MITHTCTVSAIVKYDHIKHAIQSEFSNVICRNCAFFGAPTDPCRERLTFAREQGSYSHVLVTCNDFCKDINVLITEKLKELELAHNQYVTACANLDSFMKLPVKAQSTKDKFNILQRTLEGLKITDPMLNTLLNRKDATEGIRDKCERELADLRARQNEANKRKHPDVFPA